MPEKFWPRAEGGCRKDIGSKSKMVTKGKWFEMMITPGVRKGRQVTTFLVLLFHLVVARWCETLQQSHNDHAGDTSQDNLAGTQCRSGAGGGDGGRRLSAGSSSSAAGEGGDVRGSGGGEDAGGALGLGRRLRGRAGGGRGFLGGLASVGCGHGVNLGEAVGLGEGGGGRLGGGILGESKSREDGQD
jgi:hypothetical protein